MNTIEIKKELYKQKPVAIFERATKTALLYSAELIEGAETIYFSVPFIDIGDASFEREMPSQLLIRYLITKEQLPA